ncbi:MAG: FAD-binding domain [Microbacteriaceae bacterium]|nr:FAD-binding domain [Microbacteriaceae bacterium]
MRVLIVGAGIAGPTLAYWLRRSGHEPTLLEHAPEPRRGGYLVDFWGAGFDIAEWMGIVPELMRRGYIMREMREIGADGRRVASIDPGDLIGLAGGRYVTIARSDLAAVIMTAAQGHGVETIYGDTVESLHDDGDAVHATLRSGAERTFDLVVGADGLHSRVRRLAFGPDEDYERGLGIAVAAFEVDGYAPRDEDIAVAHTEVGFQALRVALRDGATLFLITFRHDGPIPEDDVPAQQAVLREALAGAGGEVPAILDRLADARTFYFDTASQIRMPAWSAGRIALVGDAGACPSLLAGQGSALAMIEAYTLVRELELAGGDRIRALTAYHDRLAAMVLDKQDAAIGLGVAFAPRNGLQLVARNTIMRMMTVPFIARLAMGRSLRDQFELVPPADG